MIIVTGRTFEHRNTLSALNGWFNRAEKRWEMPSLTAGQIEQLRCLVGLVVTITEPETMAPTTTVRRSRLNRLTPSVLYGDDATYHNHFADQNPAAFVGFSSLAAMVEYVDEIPSSVSDDYRRNLGWESDAEWSGTPTMWHALTLAREGWREGLERAEAIIERLALANPRVRRRKPALAGGSVSVGRMLSGDPAHMIRRPPQPGRKVVTFFVEAGCSAMIRAETMIIRAALIGAIIDLMENVGYSCTVVAVDTSLESLSPLYQLAVTLKESGERLNLADLMFALGHPSFLRRLSFATSSSLKETRPIWLDQGHPSNAFHEDHPCAQNEYYVPVIEKNGDDPFALLPYVMPPNLPITIEKD